VFSRSPLRPAYAPHAAAVGAESPSLSWIAFPGGLRTIGHPGHGFHYDNEAPRHRVFLQAFELASRAVTCGEYLGFVADGGYARSELWLSDGWDAVQRNRWNAPLYWECRDGEWWAHTLSGMRPVDRAEPVCHVSYYEADAFARWSGARLPFEAEWEAASASVSLDGNFVESGAFHPRPARGSGLQQMFGDVWEWTASAYSPYPGFRPEGGAVGEYNGKFMVNQLVLRGGSCATPASHIRRTYRNFFPAEARWQFSGIRLAR
jgi:ergothioneine biosynthesis protein EgtB